MLQSCKRHCCFTPHLDELSDIHCVWLQPHIIKWFVCLFRRLKVFLGIDDLCNNSEINRCRIRCHHTHLIHPIRVKNSRLSVFYTHNRQSALKIVIVTLSQQFRSGLVIWRYLFFLKTENTQWMCVMSYNMDKWCQLALSPL